MNKTLTWIGSARKDLKDFPKEVRQSFGYALWQAQQGHSKPRIAKVLKGFGGAGVLELLEDHEGNTYRAVYALKFSGAVYVLHAFQKKSKRGAKTPKSEFDLVRSRLKIAEKHYEKWKESEKKEPGNDGGAK